MGKFDPRTVLVSTFIYILALIFMDSPGDIFLVGAFISLHLYIFRLDMENLKRILKYSATLFISIVFVNYLFMGRDALYIILSLIRVLGVILVSVSILSSMEIMDIGYALEKLFSPLEKLGIPVHVISTILAVSLKFIPLLKDEGDRIVLAQKARGVDFSLMTIREKAGNIGTLFLPVIISGIQHSINLATAMEVRGYGAEREKTRLYESKMEKKDYIYIFVSILPLLFEKII
ncbi:MAG: energy-coupling factor transporter transmembrane component T family protein [Fusobacteriaceae bacterium]